MKKSELNKNNVASLISQKLFFLKNFNVIELINSKLKIFINENIPLKYSIDLNIKNNSAFVLLSELDLKENFITVNFDFSDNFNFNFNANNFETDFISFFFPEDFLVPENLIISGDSSLVMSRNSKIENFDFNLFLDGKISYQTNFDKKRLNFDNDKLYGIFNDNELSVSFNFNDIKSTYSVGVSTNKKNKSYFFFKN